MTQILSKTTRRGEGAEMFYDTNNRALRGKIDGKTIFERGKVRPLETPEFGYTHIAFGEDGIVAGACIGLTTVEAETIKSFLALVTERRRLVGAWESAQNHEFNARESAYEAEQGRPNFVNHEASLVTAAKAALQAFDAAHPEIASI